MGWRLFFYLDGTHRKVDEWDFDETAEGRGKWYSDKMKNLVVKDMKVRMKVIPT